MREWLVAIEFERLSGNVFPESLFCAGAVEGIVVVGCSRPPGVRLFSRQAPVMWFWLFFSSGRPIPRAGRHRPSGVRTAARVGQSKKFAPGRPVEHPVGARATP